MTRVRQRRHQLNCEFLEGRQLLSTFTITNASSGMQLDDPGGSKFPGLVEQFHPTGVKAEQWDIVVVGNFLSDSMVKVVNVKSGLALTDPNDSAIAGTIMQQQKYLGDNGQKWVVVPLADGNVRLMCLASYELLTDPSSSPVSGTPIREETGPIVGPVPLNQQWKLSSVR